MKGYSGICLEIPGMITLEELKANMINAIMLAIKSMDREAHDKQRMVIERRSMRIGS